MLASRLYILAAALLWSTAGAAIKLCSLHAWQIASGRSAVAAILLFAFFPAARAWPSRRVLAVATAHAATVLLFVLATKSTTAANAIFIQDTAPLFVMLMSPLVLGERPQRRELFAAPVDAAGLAMFFFDQLAPGHLAGNLLALASGVAFAASIVGLRMVREEGVRAIAYGNILAALAGLLPALWGPAPIALDLGLVLFLGVFQLGLANVFFSRGLLRVPAVEASLMVLAEPVLNPVWAFLLAGERPGLFSVAGGVVILTATVWQLVAAARPRAAARAEAVPS